MNKIGYLSFGRDNLAYGLSLCLDSIPKENKFRVTPKTANLVDYLCFSIFWWEHLYLLADFLRRAGISKINDNRPQIIIGGFNTFNPIPLSCYADFVICGDGEDAFPAVLRGEENSGIYCGPGTIATWQNIDSLKAFCIEMNDIARIELARGCKFRCHFCAVTHLKPYRETPFEEIESILKTIMVKRISLFAPEPTLHYRDEEITDLCHRLGKIRVDSDVRLDRVSLRKDSVPRVGIEGLSEKLRKSVGKPYSNSKIVQAINEMIKQGRRGLFIYLILDLPGEQEEDWAEFAELLREVGTLPGAGEFLLKPSPSVFMPMPHTPMELDCIHWDRDYATKWAGFFGRGDDRKWKLMIAERSRVFKPAMRILSMIATRAGAEFLEIENELTKTKTISISGGHVKCNSEKSLIKILGRYGGVEKYCGPYEDDPPWKCLTIPKGSLL